MHHAIITYLSEQGSQQGMPLQASSTAHLCPIEPEAAEAVEHARLHEPHPARVHLHDDCKGAVGAEDDVVNHGRMVGHPHAVGGRHRPRPVEPNDACSVYRRRSGGSPSSAAKLGIIPHPGAEHKAALNSGALGLGSLQHDLTVQRLNHPQKTRSRPLQYQRVQVQNGTQ